MRVVKAMSLRKKAGQREAEKSNAQEVDPIPGKRVASEDRLMADVVQKPEKIDQPDGAQQQADQRDGVELLKAQSQKYHRAKMQKNHFSAAQLQKRIFRKLAPKQLEIL